MYPVKILVTLPRSVIGGADIKSINVFRALRIINYDVSPLVLPFNAKPYFINYLKSYNSLLKHILCNYLNSYHRIIIITTYPQYLYHLLNLKEVSKMKIIILWLPGGNDFCCPLHTEVCPKTVLNNSYGCAHHAAFFFAKCVPHMLRLKRFSIYHSLLWPNLRRKALRNLDGLLASRSIYIKGCKYMSYNRCYYVGVGIDTGLFKPRDKDKAIKVLSSLSKHVLFGDFNNLLESARENKCTVIGHIGAAEPWWKNLETLILAFRGLSHQVILSTKHRIWLLIVGRSTSKLLTLLNIMPESIKKNIVIINRVSYEVVPYIYNIVDIFVNPSHLDSLEYNTLEALASGNIVLVSNRGSIDDLRYYNVNVLKFEPDPHLLINLLKLVFHDLENFKKMFLLESKNVRKLIGLEAFALRLKEVLNKYIE